jgi:ABC-type transporter Mla MlaB component
VLRISVINDSKETIQLRVEGSLVGPWVDELRRQSDEASSHAARVTIDLEKLRFADSTGVALLRELAEKHIAHLNCSPFISQQLKETSL